MLKKLKTYCKLTKVSSNASIHVSARLCQYCASMRCVSYSSLMLLSIVPKMLTSTQLYQSEYKQSVYQSNFSANILQHLFNSCISNMLCNLYLFCTTCVSMGRFSTFSATRTIFVLLGVHLFCKCIQALRVVHLLILSFLMRPMNLSSSLIQTLCASSCYLSMHRRL